MEDKKRVEEFLIREFIQEGFQLTISSFESCERPDAMLTLQDGDVEQRVAVEVTEYYNDTVAGECSPLSPVSDFWDSVVARLGDNQEALADLLGRIELYPRQLAIQVDRKTQKKTQLDPEIREQRATQLADEIVAFVKTHPVTDSATFPVHSPAGPGREFVGFPVLKSMVSTMRLRRAPGTGFSPCHWRCTNLSTGSIGLNLEFIRTTIKSKNGKARCYDWQSADKKWLLIVAACGNLNENASRLAEREWNDSELRELCRESPFDRIYFWERCRGWCKVLK